MYGWPDGASKYKTWNLLRYLCEDADVPIMLGGDFNEILGYEEKEGGVDTDRREIRKFREAVDECGLREMSFEGTWYTWERGLTPETRVRERLDRVLASPSWYSLFPGVGVEPLMRYKSDHAALLVRAKTAGKQKRKKKGKGYKFETSWLLDEECEQVVKEAWNRAVGESVERKLAAVASSLVGWSGTRFEGLGKKISDTEKALHAVQQLPVTSDTCEEKHYP